MSFDEYDAPECWACDDKQEIIDNVRSFFQGVLNNLYDRNKLNLSDLERCLDEMAGYLDMKLPTGQLQVRGALPTSHMLEEWKAINNMYLNSLKPQQLTGV